MPDQTNALSVKFQELAVGMCALDTSDKSKLLQIGTALEELVQLHSQDLSDVLPLIYMSLEGLQLIYEEKSNNLQTIVFSISKIFSGIGGLAAGAKDVAALLNEAGVALWQALGRDVSACPYTAAATAPASALTEKFSAVNRPDTAGDFANKDSQIIEEFVTESFEFIETAENALLILETDSQNQEAVNTVFRAFHTIKGTSMFLGLSLVSQLSHLAENLLSRIRNKEVHYAGGYADLALCSLDMIKILVENARDSLHGKAAQDPEGYARLLEILQDPEVHGISEKSSQEVSGLSLRLGDILVSQGKVSREKMEEIAGQNDRELLGLTLIKSKSASLTDVGKALRLQQQLKNTISVTDTSIRVSTERLDKVVTMIDELSVAYSLVIQDRSIFLSLHDELLSKVTHIGKVIRGLQDLGMSLSMVPLRPTFQKMARVVRDVAHKSDKLVDFVTSGEDVEIDRGVIDGINDSLVHLIRNAVDHGIDRPEEREKCGKPKIGTVHLSACYRSGAMVIEIRDDGKGLNREKILAKAIAMKLIKPEDVVGEAETLNLIFEPGFSTADKVTDISGRGVGLDVVKRGIESYKGSIDVVSEPGRGSTFRISLPLTMAIITGSLIRVGVERYIIPADRILLSQHAQDGSITVIDGNETFLLEGKPVPIIRLHKMFNVKDACENISKGLLLIIENKGERYALFVDELLGQQQVVVKSLGRSLGKIGGISGRAILGDGCIGLILDPQEMLTSIQNP